MRSYRSTLSAMAMSLLLSSLGPASAAAQGPGWDEEGNRSLERLRSALLTSVAVETEGPAAFGRPGIDVVAIEGPEKIEDFVRDLGHGLPEVFRTRVFQAGRWLTADESATAAIDRQEAVYHRFTGSLFVVGSLGNRVILEDVRTIEDGGRVFVLRDIYLDGEAADLRVGRSLPVLLESADSKATPAPVVTSLGGITSSAAGVSNGRVAMGSCGGTYDGGVALNDQTGVYPWTVNGSNFGSTAGRVSFAGRDVPVRSGWSSTRITAEPTSAVGASPATALLKVTTSTGASTSYGVSFVPAIRSRVYGQCTWFVALTRLSMGLQPSASAYGGYSPITTQWVPKAGDQLQWQGKHTAIITAVSGPVTSSGGYQTYKLTIKQYNADCRNSPSTYTADFILRTVNGQTTVSQYPKSSVTSLGVATSYYR